MTIVFKGSTGGPREDMKYTSQHLVSFAAVIQVVMQRFSPTSGGKALRDDLNNGCEGDYATPPLYKKLHNCNEELSCHLELQ